MLYVYAAFVLIVLIFFLYLIIRRRKYTHERFAFYALGALISFASTAIIPVFAGSSVIELLVKAFFLLFDRQIDAGSNIYDKILSLIVLLFLGHLALKFHAQWPEKTTDRKTQILRHGQETTIFSDALAELEAIRNNEPLKLAKEEDDARYETAFDLAEEVTWRRRALRLLMAYSSQYQIDAERDWIGEVNSYFCSYGKNSLPAVVFCADKVPDIEDFRKIKMECDVQDFQPRKFLLLCSIGGIEQGDWNSIGLPKIEILAEGEILEKIANFNAYKRYIIRKFEEDLVSPTANLTLFDTYVPVGASIDNHNVGVVADGRKKSIPDIEEYISLWSLENGPKHLSILGDYGQGKSTLMLKVAYNYFKLGIGERIPVIIELRGRNPRNEQIEQIVYPWCKKFGFSPDSLLALHEAGKIILILDGFDEMDYVGDAEIRYTHMRRIWEFSKYSNSKILITGRPNFFFGTMERRRALLIRDELGARPYCEEIRLSHLTIAQAEKAVAGFSQKVVEGISSALREGASNTSLSELLLRPSTLIWAATVWASLTIQIGNAPVLSADVVRRFIRQANERQQSKEMETVLMRSERQYLTSAVAMTIHSKQAGTNQISATQLRATIAECLETIPDSLRDFCEPGEDKKVTVRERFQQPQRLVETIATEIRAGGILVEDLSKPDTFRFAHKSFYEYLVAEMIAARVFPRIKKEMGSALEFSVENTSYHIVWDVYSGLMKSSIEKPNLFAPQVLEVDQFAGETVISLAIENFHDKNADWPPSEKFIRRICKATRHAWCGRGIMGTMALYEVTDLKNLEPVIAGASVGRLFRSVLRIYRPLFIASFLPMRSRVRSWVFGCLGLGVSRPEDMGWPINFQALGIRETK